MQSVGYPTLRDEIKAYYPEWEQADVLTADSIFADIDNLFNSEKYIMESLNSFEAYEDAMVLFDVEPQVQEGGVVIDLSDALVVKIKLLSNKYLVQSDAALSKTSSSFTVLQWVIIIMSLLILVVSLGTAYYLYSSIVEPLTKSVTFAKSIGDGDLTAAVDINQHDEIGDLAKALVLMAKNLKNTVLTIKHNANDLVSSSSQLKTSSIV